MITWLDDAPLPTRFDNADELDDFLSRLRQSLAIS
jgi:hypothetical protein